MGRALANNNSATAKPIKAGGTWRRQGDGSAMFCKIQETPEKTTTCCRFRLNNHTYAATKSGKSKSDQSM
jgi:hypothetical protein